MMMTSGVGRVETRFTTVAESGLRLDCGRRARADHRGVGAVRRREPGSDERRARVPRALGRRARGRLARAGRQGRVVGRAGRSGPGVRHDALLRGEHERAGRVLRHDRTGVGRSGDGQRVRTGLPASHGLGHGPSPARAAHPPRRPLARRGRRRIDGRHAGAGLGCALPGLGRDRSSRSRRPTATRRSRSRSTRWRDARSWPTPSGEAAGTKPGQGRLRASLSPGCSATSRTCPTPGWNGSSGGGACRPRQGDRGTRNSRSSGISITRGRASSADSTPTRCST